MEKITNRDKFSQNFYEICNKIELNDQLIDALSKHHNFSDDMKTVLVRYEKLKKLLSLFN